MLYIEVVSSGIQVFGLQNGVDYIVIGSQQEIALNPAEFSFDMDGYISPKLLNFKFYCQLVDFNSSNSVFNNTDLDLKTLKNKNLVNSSSCFNSTGKF